MNITFTKTSVKETVSAWLQHVRRIVAWDDDIAVEMSVTKLFIRRLP